MRQKKPASSFPPPFPPQKGDKSNPGEIGFALSHAHYYYMEGEIKHLKPNHPSCSPVCPSLRPHVCCVVYYHTHVFLTQI